MDTKINEKNNINTEKDSFLTYLDYKEQFDLLNNEQAGELIKALIVYEKEHTIPNFSDGMIKIAFSFIKTQLDKDRQKRNEEKKKKSNAGKQGMLSRWSKKVNENDKQVEDIVEEKENELKKDNKDIYNKDAEKIQKVLIETIGTTNINNIKECVDYLDKLPFELIEYALRKTARIQHPSWQYAIPILESYIDKGFKNVNEAIANDLNFKNKKAPVDNGRETEEEKINRKVKSLEEALYDDS